MRKQFYIGSIVVGVLVLGWLVLKLFLPIYTYNQTLTLTFSTPEGPVVATNTAEISYTFGLKLLPDAGGLSARYNGEALVADLGQDRYIFATVDRSLGLAEAAAIANGLIGKDLSLQSTQSYLYWSQYWPGDNAWDVPDDALPSLVTFGDISDVSSFQYVDPKDLQATFGAGYSLEMATISISREPLTEGKVEPLLFHWLKTKDVFYSDAPTQFRNDNNGTRVRLHTDQFWQGRNEINLRGKYR